MLVVGGESRDAGLQDRHRVPVGGEGVEERLEILVQEAVPLEPLHVALVGTHVRQFAVDQKIGHLQEGGVGRELIDWVPAVAQDASIAINVGDRRFAGRGVHEAAVQSDEPGLLQEGGDHDAVVPLRCGHTLKFEFLAVYGEGGGGGLGHEDPL